jgi:hypothetical protein
VSSTPAALDDVTSRISSAPGSDLNQATGEESRDELVRLAAWWQRVGGSQEPSIARLTRETITEGGSADSTGVCGGIAAADRAIDGGANLVTLADTDSSDLPARAVMAILCHRDAATVTFQTDGVTDREWSERCGRVRDDIAQWLSLRGEPWMLADASGDESLAWMAGVLLAAAARRTPVIVDGVRALTAAVIADRAAPAASTWWRAATTSSDPTYEIARDRIALARGLPLNIADTHDRAIDATVALLAVARQR